MRRHTWLVFALSLIAAPAVGAGSTDVAKLVTRARTLGLAQHPQWRDLLHYKPRIIRAGVESLVDDPGFFLAPDGKTNPQAELEATVAALFAPGTQGAVGDDVPACRFVARYQWLRDALGVDAPHRPAVDCERYRDWRAALNAQSITLIFAASFLNNPASMYGHTLLRIDAHGQDERTRLLGTAVNYAANTTDRAGFVYALKGLTGGYRGQFSLAPYFVKVREYNDLESRDLWEYRLNLTTAEIDRLLAHLWELMPAYFDYYFFDENCSYHLLSLLEVARPGIALTDQFPVWATPVDTLRAVAAVPGLVGPVAYRPAASTLLRHRMAVLAPPSVPLAQALGEQRTAVDDERLTALSPAQQAEVLESAHVYASFNYAAAGEESEASRAHLHALLQARSRLPAGEPQPPPVPPVRPEQGHETARLDIGLGRDGGRNFGELRVRGSYHDLLDPEAGYVRGAQIEFFALSARRYEDTVQLEEFLPVNIISLAPRDAFIQPWSWKLAAGWTRLRLADGARPLAGRIAGGGGVSGEFGDSLAALLLEATLDVDSALDKGYAFGAGPSFRWSVDVSRAWRAQLTAGYQAFEMGHEHRAGEVALSQRYAIGRETAWRLDLARRKEYGARSGLAQVSWLVYF